ncbi:MAG: HAMP domain-containing histidine kinase [Saccharofermentans sp.]|nr:HAMP domain-containing histidine kinase [Saccharofermentans sp.]
MTEEVRLRKFITKRFVVTLVLVGVAEFFISSFLNHVMLPSVIPAIFPELSDPADVSAGTVIFLLVILILNVIAGFLDKLIPAGGRVLSLYITRELEKIGFAAPDSAITDMSLKDTVFLILTFVAIVIVMLAPIVIGAWNFAGKVSSEFRKLDRIRADEQKAQDRKRYLMISDIAHDLKTPMTTVSGYARALSEGMIKPEKQQEYLDTITAKTERMNDIIQMLFNYSRLDSDGFELVKAPLDICELARECVAASYTDIEEAGDEIDIDIPEERLMCQIDKVQLARSINNLITNAVKHNSKGTKIFIGVKDEIDSARVFVADSGETIPQELEEKLFEPFVMGDESRSTKGGSGLGLSVSKKIAELHDGRLKLVQKPDMGRYQLGEEYNKVFIISLPVEDN